MANKTSYKRVASAQLTTKQGVLKAYAVGTNGVANGKIEIFDVSAAADVANTNCMWECTVVAANFYGGRNVLPDGIPFHDGLYVRLTGDGAFYFIEYE